MIRQYIIWRNNHAYDGRVGRVVDRAFLHHQHLRRTTAPSASSYYYVGWLGTVRFSGAWAGRDVRRRR